MHLYIWANSINTVKLHDSKLNDFGVHYIRYVFLSVRPYVIRKKRKLLVFGGGSFVVDFLFIVTPIVGVCNCSLFCCTLHYVHSRFAIIWMGKRELVTLLSLSSWCLVMVVWFFLAVPWVCLRFVIVVFPDHTHLLYFGCFR